MCPRCKGDLLKKTIRYIQEYEGRIAVIDNVPAEVCTQCGETVLTSDVARTVQRIVWGEIPQTGEVTIPRYDFACVT